MITTLFSKAGALAAGALCLTTLTATVDSASAQGRVGLRAASMSSPTFMRGPSNMGGSGRPSMLNVRPMSGSALGARNSLRMAPIVNQRGTSYSQIIRPGNTRKALSNFQPSNNSSGVYAPWMTRTPYGVRMAGNPAARAVAACKFMGTC